MSFAWIGKATVQATLSSIILNTAKNEKITEYYDYGLQIQTTSIFSIIICAPLGAILMNTFAPKLLTVDLVDEKKGKEGAENEDSKGGAGKDCKADDNLEVEVIDNK